MEIPLSKKNSPPHVAVIITINGIPVGYEMDKSDALFRNFFQIPQIKLVDMIHVNGAINEKSEAENEVIIERLITFIMRSPQNSEGHTQSPEIFVSREWPFFWGRFRQGGRSDSLSALAVLLRPQIHR
ncbi:hypothetical protein [Pseudomonas fluorescens]|uniref:hypothetical protein n=1 Tax=Pseudomonas fluorescens TaxID=294 RepID=UPI00124050EF|nr:hypothetical protein [Pseudomonas fluorescens]